MTSLGDRSWGPRDKVLPTVTQASQTQRQIQATAEQIRLAQMIYDTNDADFEDKIKQLMEVTGKNQDECVLALHDCKEDIIKAINFLLEGSSDVTSWETVGRRRVPGKESSSTENKENREKRMDKEAPRGRGEANRRGRGANHSQEGRGRGSARVGSRFSAQRMGTFNPADYTPDSAKRQVETQGTGSWQNPLDDWAVEDWNEDLSETKVFTASSVPVTEHHATAAQSLDLASLLKKPNGELELDSTEPHSPQALGHSLVFTNSHHQPPPNGGPALSYAHAALSSVLGVSLRDVDVPKLSPSAAVQTLEQMKEVGPNPCQPTSSTAIDSVASHGRGASSSSSSFQPVAAQFSRDFGTQPEPSLVLSQLTHGQQDVGSCTKPSASAQLASPSIHVVPSTLESSKPRDSEGSSSSGRFDPLTTCVLESQVCSTQQRQAKIQKRKIPPASKIPVSAVEMPGLADVSGLNVQFGALDFASEPALPVQIQPENGPNSSVPEAAPAPHAQNLHLRPPISYHQPPVSLCDLPSPTLRSSGPVYSPPFTPGFEGSLPPDSRPAYPHSPDPNPSVVSNVCHGAKTSPAADSLPSTTTPKADCPSQVPSSGTAAPLVPTDSSMLPVRIPEALADHSSAMLNGSSSSCASSSVTNSSVDTPNCLPLLSGSDPGAVSGWAVGSGGLGLIGNRAAVPSMCRTAPLPPSSNKAPPNLTQGVSPLLTSQYIVGPGGLLPAYPIYGYEDLHVLQSRLSMEYYGMAFPNPTVPLSSRDGNLPNSSCSGEETKFGRADSPAPASTMLTPLPPQPAPPPQNQPQNQSHQQPHHSSQQTFLNPALPPGYSYPGLPYYPSMAGVPGTFQYGPTVFVPPASAKQQGVGLGGASGPLQQHSYGSGYDNLTQGPPGTGEYNKGYNGLSQAQAKCSAAGSGKVISVTSSSGAADSSGSVYKTQAFDGQGFHTGTTPPFSLPSALGSSGPLNPGGGPGYTPAPFLHILPAHQQPQGHLLHHSLTQDNQGSQRTQSNMSQATKATYGSSPYWGN
ncbi:ubiquitin-associated protein 2a isoform X2 [Brienomyrus brachyistius]|uniref:ubiquitin-associated protein 2a isoform X2 n=1 Tax=Brienomyrus brachyistius TaxID=42636 RepID=UPI0020B2FD12|nr:ubiquitin-associated protein 2a isoform X2 [Brienomyrus brachyistius]